MNAPTRVVVLSGGLDSTTVLALAVRQAESEGAPLPAAVSFDYGQRHSRELESAKAVAAHFGVRHSTIDISGLLHGAALVSASAEYDVPDGHYAEANMKQTVVNGRNLLFASVAIAAVPGAVLSLEDQEGGARASAVSEVWLGVHAGDHFIYPDCRAEFWDALAALSLEAYGVALVTPLLRISKSDGLKLGVAAGAPVELSWSCYKGGVGDPALLDENGEAVACGRCGTDVERAEAFALAGIPDPTRYADPDFWKTAVGAASA